MEIPTRADIPETDKWDLTHLFADVSKWQEDFAWLQREYPKLEQWKGRVGNQPRHWLGFSSLRRRSSRRWNASITTPRCKRPRTARITITSHALVRSRIYLQGSARRRRLLFRKFSPSRMNALPNFLPILRSRIGRSSCTKSDECDRMCFQCPRNVCSR